MPASPSPSAKGLKPGALSFWSNVTIGVASTSPAFSLAAALGPMSAQGGLATPGIILLSFVPMLFIATACYYLNRADSDCGTTFAWVTRAMGPSAGWIGGWCIIVTDILVMPSLANVAGAYSLRLLGVADPSATVITAIGVAWIVAMTVVCYLGIKPTARTQALLTVGELLILAIFAVVALSNVYGPSPHAASQRVALNWFNPFSAPDSGAFAEASVTAIFIYWGWDCCVSVNEETTQPARLPGLAAILSTVILLGVYAAVAVATLAVVGPDFLRNDAYQDDVLAPVSREVFGHFTETLLLLAVLASAVASTQTTILPTARIVLSMACAGALPRPFGAVDPRTMTPGTATLAMGAVSIVWYVALSAATKNVLRDSITAIGLVIAFYYALTAFACVLLYRRRMRHRLRDTILAGVIPFLGGVIMVALFVKVTVFPGDASKANVTVLGIGGPVLIGVGSLLLGALLLLLAQRGLPDFFRRRPQVLDPGACLTATRPPD